MNRRQVPQVQTVPQTGKAPQAQFLINQVTKHAEIPQRQYCDKVIAAMPVVIQRQVPRTQTCLKTVESPASAVHRQSCECANDHADHEVAGGYFQQGDQARRDSADSFLRPGCWRASCDTATGPSDTDGFENREIPDGTVRRQSRGRARDHDDHAVGAQRDRGARQAR